VSLPPDAAVQQLPQAVDGEAAEAVAATQGSCGRSIRCWFRLPLLFLKAGLAGSRLRPPSSAGSTATGTGAAGLTLRAR
jgi:hypothetical protein